MVLANVASLEFPISLISNFLFPIRTQSPVFLFTDYYSFNHPLRSRHGEKQRQAERTAFGRAQSAKLKAQRNCGNKSFKLKAEPENLEIPHSQILGY